MQGMEILNKEPVMIQDDKLLVAGFICLGITSILCVILTNMKNEKIQNITFNGVVLGFIISLILCIAYKKVEIPSDKYQYEAIIDNDVSINEVYKHYNVIDQKGKKWILEDKECAE